MRSRLPPHPADGLGAGPHAMTTDTSNSAERSLVPWMPGRWRIFAAACLLGPALYAFLLTQLLYADADLAAAWVTPGLPLIQEHLPTATPFLRGFEARGTPMAGMVRVHSLAVALGFGAAG